MKNLLFAILLFLVYQTQAQQGDFPLGQVSVDDLTLKVYDKDTSAVAVFLREYGFCEFSDQVNIRFTYHAKIKILKKGGLDWANFEIPLYKSNNGPDDDERWVSLEAFTHNLDESGIRKTTFNNRDFILEKTNKNYNTAKFALPDVRVGSVIEIKYTTTSPYIFYFHDWTFQDEIPKVHSEYHAKIPAHFTYNIILRGYQKLSVNKGETIRDCWSFPGTGTGPFNQERSGCSLYTYAMRDIPAFVEEEFMTARKNNISAIHYELSEVVGPTGTKTKYAEDWSDVVKKMEEHDYFGKILKKARKLMDDKLPEEITQLTNAEEKTRAIFDFVRNHYVWNGDAEKYTKEDPKKVFDSQKGSSADLNLALIAALQAAKIDAHPLLTATRDFGTPNELLPQRTDFNYVMAYVNQGNSELLLDITDPILPYGVLPIRCLNGKGILLDRADAKWIQLKPALKQKTTVNMVARLHEDGKLEGFMVVEFQGYESARYRRKLYAHSEEEFIKEITKDWRDIVATNHRIHGKDSIDQPLKIVFDISSEENSIGSATTLYFDPFLVKQFESNPFKSAERLYPVDLAAPIENTYFITLTVPEHFVVEEAPGSVGIALPNGGGKFLLNVARNGNEIAITSVATLAKPVYSSAEYANLREYFTKIIQAQQSQFVFKKLN